MSEWTDEERAVAEVIWTASRADESTISATGANHVARALLASGVVVPARLVEEAERERDARTDAWAGALRDLSSTAHDRDLWRLHAERAEAELSRLRSAVEALADEWEGDAGEDQAWLNGPRVSVSEAHELPALIRQAVAHVAALTALLTAGRDRAGEGAGT